MPVLISHPGNKHSQEKKLYDHLENVANNSAAKIADQKLQLTLIGKDELVRLSYLIGLFHDLGKATSYFQKYIRQDDKSKRQFTLKKLKNHSLISSILAYYLVKQEFKNDLWAYLTFQIIFRHHGNLVDFNLSRYKLDIRTLKKQLENIKNFSYNKLEKFYTKHKVKFNTVLSINFSQFQKFLKFTDFFVEENISRIDQKIEYFLINNYLFSLLIESDKADASRINEDVYFEGNLDKNFYDVDSYIEYCRKKEPEKFDLNKQINQVRSEFLKDIVTNNNISHENHLYTLTAPTGIGKTFACMSFAKVLKRKIPDYNPRIIYCLPYTSIIDQNYKIFEKLILNFLKEKYSERPNRYLLKHHYLTPKEIKNRINDNRRYKDYLDDKLLVESWQSSLIVTTFVQLFHSIFSNRNKSLKKFHNIVNSILIFDEVQNVDPNYYLMMKEVFEIFAERFNTYFLLMTATQPEILSPKRTIELVDPKKYMQNPIFNRVSLRTKTQRNTLEDFVNEFVTSFKGRNALIVVNTKKVALKLYNHIKEKFCDFACFCLTNYLIPKDKEEKINQIDENLKAGDKIIVVSTQLIEAGVDLSFEYVYRDLAPLDSIIQVAGRCNRSNEYGTKNGKMNLVNLNNYKIYNKKLIELMKEILSQKEHFTSSDFYELSREFYRKLKFESKSKKILISIRQLNYDTQYENQIPISDFSLIQENLQRSIYIFPNKEDQKIMDRFLFLKTKLEKADYKDNSEKEKILLEIEDLKINLKQFQISLYNSDLKSYRDYLRPEAVLKDNPNYPYQFIPYNILKYDKNIGFMTKSREEQIEDQFI